MTRIAPEWLHAPATRNVVEALSPADPRFVGGCVRDALMGRATADIDIAVRTPPEETMRLARAAGLSAYPTGIDHGVVTVTAAGASFEATTLRRDVATDGRRAVIAFAETLTEDARRRDFTMNALYADAAGAVVDPTGCGLEDLNAGRIRFIGDAAQRIREDYLRILRFFRFHAQFAITAFDDAALAACADGADGLVRISGERIAAEMIKLLTAPDPEPALAAMGRALAIAMPGAAAFTGLTAAEAALGERPEAVRRLALMGGYEDLPLSRAHRTALEAISRARAHTAKGASLAACAYRTGAAATRDALLLDVVAGRPAPADWRAEIDRGAAAVFPVAARDLIALGMTPGPELGARLKVLEEAWVASGFTLTREEALAR